MDTSEILDMIDHTLNDYTSPDAMRWTPEVMSPVKLEEGDLLTINQVRDALRRMQRRRTIMYRFDVEVDTLSSLVGTITTVDPDSGQIVQTPFVSGTVRPLP